MIIILNLFYYVDNDSFPVLRIEALSLDNAACNALAQKQIEHPTAYKR